MENIRDERINSFQDKAELIEWIATAAVHLETLSRVMIPKFQDSRLCEFRFEDVDNWNIALVYQFAKREKA